jgi:predicted NBD/HSP70 family sugar kinase
MNGDDRMDFRLASYPLDEDQIALFTHEGVEPRTVGTFEPEKAWQKLRAINGKQALGIDLGGSKVFCALYCVKDGALVVDQGAVTEIEHENGKGCLGYLEKCAKRIKDAGLCVGFSFAGIVEGGIVRAGPHVPLFVDDLMQKCNGDLKEIIPQIQSVQNDAVAGMIGALTRSSGIHENVHSCIFIVNGSGLGAAVMKDGIIIATEVGHTLLSPSVYRRISRMQVAPPSSIEVIAASKAGVERRWQEFASTALTGHEIAQKLYGGDPLARRLYTESAWITAHTVAGLANIFRIQPEKDCLVMYHGGIFKVAGFSECVTDTLQRHYNHHLKTIETTHMSRNICAEGAALLALLAPKEDKKLS